MNVIVNPNYRWLNSLLVAVFAIAALTQCIQAVLYGAVAFHLAMGIMGGVVALLLYRVVPWIYLAIALLNFLCILGILNSISTTGLVGFVELAIAAAVTWAAVAVRSNLMVPIALQSSQASEQQREVE